MSKTRSWRAAKGRANVIHSDPEESEEDELVGEFYACLTISQSFILRFTDVESSAAEVPLVDEEVVDEEDDVVEEQVDEDEDEDEDGTGNPPGGSAADVEEEDDQAMDVSS